MPRTYSAFFTFLFLALIGATTLSAPRVAHANDPNVTIRDAEAVLSELVAIPARRIPRNMLAEAQAIAIIPRVIKVGFVVGIRRGQGVVMTRDADGEWSLPQFLTLTGGSIGWQAGVQGTDVVLIFRTRTSVENLMRGKFTIGADAAAAAGPVGRNASAATDAQLRAEILSYSRSRGLFAGVSIDGSVLEINQVANTAFYGAPSTQLPQVVPQSATDLRLYLTELFNAATTGPEGAVAAVVPPSAKPGAAVPGAVAAAPSGVVPASAVAVSPTRLEAIQNSLYTEGAQLHAILSPEWQTFLALPAEVAAASSVDRAALASTYQRFSQVNASPEFKELSARPEFQTTFDLLRQYNDALNASPAILQLPAPPAK
ncbi:MAG: Ysc84 actin-binding domain protein [Pirellula sp.]|nr:Ysc84 actin-binding domain protein [Pirellula sp.]